MKPEKVYVVKALDRDDEYDEMDFIYDICRNEATANRIKKQALKELHNHEVWVEEWNLT